MSEQNGFESQKALSQAGAVELEPHVPGLLQSGEERFLWWTMMQKRPML